MAFGQASYEHIINENFMAGWKRVEKPKSEYKGHHRKSLTIIEQRKLVELEEEEYVVLLPVSEEGEEDEGEVVILKLEDTDEDSEEESYVGVEDEEILNKVFAIFKEKYKDEFNFVDED